MTEQEVRLAMAPTAEEIASKPFSSHADVARDLLAGKGKRVLDIGCGDGKFTWLLAPHFERISAIDVNPAKIEAAKAEAAAKGLDIDFQAASGEALPFEDASFDVVVFSNSLHHIPGMDKAMAEAHRVVKPGGLVYVMEPVPAGNFFVVARLVNDETEVRTQAYRATGRIAGLERVDERMYRMPRAYASLDEWRDDQASRDPKRAELFKQHSDAIAVLFDQQAERRDGKYLFEVISRVNLLRKVA